MTQPAGTRSGLPAAADAAAGGPARRCVVPGCDRVHKAHGYCRTHYRRWQRHGDPLVDVPVSGSGSSYRTALAQVRATRGGGTTGSARSTTARRWQNRHRGR